LYPVFELASDTPSAPPPRSNKRRKLELEPEDDEEAEPESAEHESVEPESAEEPDESEVNDIAKKGAPTAAAKAKSAAVVPQEDDLEEVEANGEDDE
jgi:hypothetical protein